MKKFMLFFVFFAWIALLPAQTATAPSAGDGSSDDPWQIASLENLYWIAESSARWADHYIQTADIDASETSGWFGGLGWLPIGNATTKFTGTYHGQDHVIRGLCIYRSSTSYIGLFGYTNGATLQHLVIKDIHITGSNSYTGGIAGRIEGTTTVKYCQVSGSISGHENTGGLIGYSHITYISVPITECFTDVTLSGFRYVGGLVGKLSSGVITKSYSSGSVSASEYRAGGLVGEKVNSQTVTDCYTTADVSGYGMVGGLIGYNLGDVTNCYASGSVTVSGGGTPGGLIGDHQGGTISASYWDTQTTSCANSSGSGATGKTTVELLTQSTYGWDFTGTWWMISGQTRPFLRMEHGTQIRTAHQLQMMTLNLSADYALMNDLDMSGTKLQKDMWGTSESGGSGFVPVGNSGGSIGYFQGDLDGNGYCIDQLYINRPATNYIGLIAMNLNNALTRIGLTNVDLCGANYVGALTGYLNNADASRCFSTGSIIAEDIYVGGLVGMLDGGSLISNAYSRCTVSGENIVGGLAGANSNTSLIEYSYSTGPVTASSTNVGGFLGTISSSTVTACFWDVETDGIEGNASGANNYGATGKTTTEMKTLSTFTAANWDFKGIGETGIWNIGNDRNDGYPYLDLQYPADVPLPVTLTAFTANYINGAVNVIWVTESETENAAFRIYRDGGMLVEIEGAGTTSEPQSYAYTDNYVIPGRTYAYVLADVDLQGKETKHPEIKVEAKVEGVDLDHTIGNAYPNPFNPVTIVPLNLAKEAQVHARLYDMLGRPVQELHKGTLNIGSHTLKVDGSMLSTGIYFVHINVNNAVHVQKIALMK
jgi:hypothetical protein